MRNKGSFAMTNDSFKPSSLFRRFYRPEPVALKPIGFPLNTQSGVNFNRFYFTIATDAQIVREEKSWFDVQEGELPFEVGFDPYAGKSPFVALDDAAWKAIQTGPLHGKYFFVLPVDMAELLGFLDEEHHDPIRVLLRCDEGPVRGLYIGEDIRVSSWHIFAGKGTSLSNVLEQARILQRETRRGDHRNALEKQTSIESATGRLESLVAAL